MKVKMIPGEYNAELVEKIKALAADFDSANSDEFDAMEMLGDLQEEYGRDALMDGLYYACAARDAIFINYKCHANNSPFFSL